MPNTRVDIQRARRRALLLALLYILYKKNKNVRKKRRFWVDPILQLKQEQGDWYNLVYEMQIQNDETYFNYMRMTTTMFDYILSRVEPFITKQKTNWRSPIPAAARLSMTLRYLASGDCLQSIAWNYRIGRSTVSGIINETCEAIWESFHKDVLFTPTQDGWRKIANEFQKMWDFPNCIGALDGKHVAVICPENAGSAYYNYKGFHSIILLALVSASYKFLIVDIGAQGRHSDGGIFKNSIMGQRFYNNTMNLPEPSDISIRHNVPHVIVADEAFQLQTFTMRPYPSKNLNKAQRIFNYRLSRARRVVENAFGILASRWRIYQKPINTSLGTAEAVIKATICLHNLLMDSRFYCGENYDTFEGNWRNTSLNGFNNGADNTSFGSNSYTRRANEIRHVFTDYFTNEGQVPWQNEII